MADRKADVLEELCRLRSAGTSAVLVTVVAARGSTPRQAGAKMLVRRDGSIVGTIGGGSREAQAAAEAVGLFAGQGPRLVTLDFSAGLGGGQGPVCGGTMEVFMERIDPSRKVFVAGAGHVAFHLCAFLKILGYRTVVVDPRPEFANPERFPDAELLVTPFDGAFAGAGITASDGIVILTADHSTDQVVLRQALPTPAAYVGMIGSRRKVQWIFDGLRKEGVEEAQLARVHAPIGLDIGAESPEEIALAIAAEMVATFRGSKEEGDGKGKT